MEKDFQSAENQTAGPCCGGSAAARPDKRLEEEGGSGTELQPSSRRTKRRISELVAALSPNLSTSLAARLGRTRAAAESVEARTPELSRHLPLLGRRGGGACSIRRRSIFWVKTSSRGERRTGLSASNTLNTQHRLKALKIFVTMFEVAQHTLQAPKVYQMITKEVGIINTFEILL